MLNDINYTEFKTANVEGLELKNCFVANFVSGNFSFESYVANSYIYADIKL